MACLCACLVWHVSVHKNTPSTVFLCSWHVLLLLLPNCSVDHLPLWGGGALFFILATPFLNTIPAVLAMCVSLSLSLPTSHLSSFSWFLFLFLLASFPSFPTTLKHGLFLVSHCLSLDDYSVNHEFETKILPVCYSHTLPVKGPAFYLFVLYVATVLQFLSSFLL